MRSYTKIPLLLSLPLWFSACIVNMDLHVEDPIPLTEIRQVGSYTRVEVLAPVPVTVKRGYTSSVTITTDENQMRYFDTYIIGGTLFIEWTSSFAPGYGTEVVCLLPNLNGIVHNESSPLYVEAFPGTDRFDIKVNGTGDLHFGGDLREVNATVNGFGNLYLEGDVDYLNLRTEGPGSIFADAMWVHREAQVDLNGGGKVLLALQTGSVLDAFVGNAGRLEWWGLPAVLHYELAGNGKVVENRQPLYKKSAGSTPDSLAQTRVSR